MATQIQELTIPVKKIPTGIKNLDTELSTFLAPNALEPVKYRILRKSVDARKKRDIALLYRVEMDPEAPPKSSNYPIKKTWEQTAPIIVGAGPAGLLAAWQLARAGAKPIILERGFDVAQRTADIHEFHQTQVLNPESHYLYGEGGAGTYSDGKLYTRIKDPRCDLVLSLFAEHGAPQDILYLQRPHIGSDYLPKMIASIREEIKAMGGEFRWGSCVESLIFEKTTCKGVVLRGGEKITAPAVILAMGHSARQLILNLVSEGVDHALKGVQLGCRVEHAQTFVNHMQYGFSEIPQSLPVPEYHLVSRPQVQNILTATTFCMCPGGEIIPATDRPNALCTNGMSPYKRNLPYANAAIIATLPDTFSHAQEAFAFIDKLETRIFGLGNGGFVAPAQNIEGFLRREVTLTQPESTSYAMGITRAPLSENIPSPIYKSIAYACKYYERLAPGFIRHGKIIGAETRISSPVRFLRNPDTLASTSHANLWIAGEGAGCAGGIMSAAVDGLKIAEMILENK